MKSHNITQKVIISRPIIQRKPREIPTRTIPRAFPVPPTLPRPDIDSHVQNRINSLEREIGRLVHLAERRPPVPDEDLRARYDTLVRHYQELEHELAETRARRPAPTGYETHVREHKELQGELEELRARRPPLPQQFIIQFIIISCAHFSFTTRILEFFIL